MPFKHIEVKREYQRNWLKQRRSIWIKENGPCNSCGSSRNLEVDHIVESKKKTHRIWSWAEKRRKNELKKCQVLCETCHKKKTAIYISKLAAKKRAKRG